MIVTLFGVPGNMGTRVANTLAKEDYISQINLLVHDKKGLGKIIKVFKKNNKKYKIVYGSINDSEKVKEAVSCASYVINMAAVIPPESDRNPHAAIEANEKGVETLLSVLESIKENQPKLIHISTIGVYGDRTYKHPFAEVGDPLLISPFDIYSLTKMRGEYKVLESNLNSWVVIRQLAMLYDELLMKNVSDGLMFHTCFNTPLEWVTANDSATLIRNILRKDIKNELDESNFWKQCFNLAGGPKNRVTGYDTMALGFKMIGCGVEDFFDTNYNSLRNFHGEWYSDGDRLNNLFDYQSEDIRGFWKHVEDTHKYFKLARIVPKKLMKAMVIKRLLKSPNAPYYWLKHNDEARMLAYFGGVERFNSIPKDWKDFILVLKGKTPDGGTLDYEKLVSTPTHLEHYFDINKDRKLISIDDLRNVAKARGGKLLTEDFKDGDIYRKVRWVNSDGEKFEARPHTVLYCGHWMNVSYKEYAWDFDRLAKTDKMVAQIWYDAHNKDEDRYYWYDENFNSCYRKIGV